MMMEAEFSLPPLIFLDNSKAVPHFHCVFHIILENMEIFLSLAGGAWKAHSIMAEAGAGNERRSDVVCHRRFNRPWCIIRSPFEPEIAADE